MGKGALAPCPPPIQHRNRNVGTLPPSLFELRRTSRFAHPTTPLAKRPHRRCTLSPCGRGWMREAQPGEGCLSSRLLVRVDTTPHPALRATFSHKGRREELSAANRRPPWTFNTPPVRWSCRNASASSCCACRAGRGALLRAGQAGGRALQDAAGPPGPEAAGARAGALEPVPVRRARPTPRASPISNMRR